MSNETPRQRVQGHWFVGGIAIASILLTMTIGGFFSDWYRTEEKLVDFWFTISIFVAAIASWSAVDYWQARCKRQNEQVKENAPND